MDLTRLTQLTGLVEGEEVINNAPSVDQKLVDVLHSLTQGIPRTPQLGQNIATRPLNSSGEATPGAHVLYPGQLTTVDASSLSLSYTPGIINQSQTPQPDIMTPLYGAQLATGLPGNETPGTIPVSVTLPNVPTQLLDSNHENVLFALANSAGLVSKAPITFADHASQDVSSIQSSSAPSNVTIPSQERGHVVCNNDNRLEAGLKEKEGSNATHANAIKAKSSVSIDSVTHQKSSSSHASAASTVDCGSLSSQSFVPNTSVVSESSPVMPSFATSPGHPSIQNQSSKVQEAHKATDIRSNKEQVSCSEPWQALPISQKINTLKSVDEVKIAAPMTNVLEPETDKLLKASSESPLSPNNMSTMSKQDVDTKPEIKSSLATVVTSDCTKPANGHLVTSKSVDLASCSSNSAVSIPQAAASSSSIQEDPKRNSKTTITLTGKQLATLLDKSSGKKVLHIIPQKSSAGKLATIKTNSVGQVGNQPGIPSGKHVKVIQLKPSQIQQVKPGVYSFKLPKDSSSPRGGRTIDSLGYSLMQSKLAKSASSVEASKKKISDTPISPSFVRTVNSGSAADKTLKQVKQPTSEAHHGHQETEKARTRKWSEGVIDLTCSDESSFRSTRNIFDKFLGPDDSDNSSQDSQVDEKTLIKNSLSNAVHHSKATREVLKNASTRKELYKDIKEHLRHHVSEQSVNSIDQYTLSDSESSDSSVDSPHKQPRGHHKSGVSIRGRSLGGPLKKVIIDRSRYNQLAQVGRNVILGMASSTKGGAQVLPTGKRKRGRPRKNEVTSSSLTYPSVKKDDRSLLQTRKRGRKQKQKDFNSRFEKTELPEHLQKAKFKKSTIQENIIDLTKRQGTVIVAESSFELNEEVCERVINNLKRSGWTCTFCGKTANVGLLDTLFGPYKLRMTTEKDDMDTQDADMDSVSSEREANNSVDLWFHRECVIWTPNVCLVGTQLRGMSSALEEAGQIRCSLCKQYGASLACMTRMCGERYHFICAKQTGCQFKEENFSILCSKHKFPQPS